MKIWRDKSGKWIDFKEFSQRFAKGLEGVTPVQQNASQLFFTWITLIGLLCGIVVSIIAWDKMWWVFIILVAAVGNTIVSIIGLKQKHTQLKRVEALWKQAIPAVPKEINYAG